MGFFSSNLSPLSTVSIRESCFLPTYAPATVNIIDIKNANHVPASALKILPKKKGS